MTSYDEFRSEYIGTNPRDDFPIISLILASATLNAVLFYVLPSTIKPLTKSYIVSTIHAIVVILSVVIYYLYSKVDMQQVNRIIGGGIAGTSDEIMSYTLCFSSGYFLYDSLLMLFDKSIRTQSALIHHTTILTGVIIGLKTRVAHSCQYLLLLEEISTIPLNLKMIYHENSHLHTLFTYVFVFCFFTVRLGYGSIITYYTFLAAPSFVMMASKLGDYKNIALLVFEPGLGLTTRLLNIFWAYLILRKMFRKPKKKHVQ